MPTVTDDGHPYCKKEKDLIFLHIATKLNLGLQTDRNHNLQLSRDVWNRMARGIRTMMNRMRKMSRTRRPKKTVKKTEKRRERGNEGERKKKR